MIKHYAVPLKDKSALVIRTLEIRHDDSMRNMPDYRLNHLLMMYHNAQVYAEVICEVDDFELAVKIAHALNEEDDKWIEIEDEPHQEV